MRISREPTILLPRHRRPVPQFRTAGFTLIELLMVMTIIGILIALILPAVANVISRVHFAEAKTEISGLETALSKFKSDHNVYPPSNIVLSEVGGNWTADAKSKIREMFGTSFNFNKNRDLNNDGVISGNLDLNGAECLVFFLGGMMKPRATPTDPIGHIGFSNNPTDPFLVTGLSREARFFEFKNDRFTDLDNDGMPEYKDPLPDQLAPYWYVEASSYRTASLPPADPQHTRDFLGSTLTTTYTDGTQFHNKNSFQIISPGSDALYGLGGVYKPDDASALTIDEQDNLTNFAKGVLGN